MEENNNYKEKEKEKMQTFSFTERIQYRASTFLTKGNVINLLLVLLFGAFTFWGTVAVTIGKGNWKDALINGALNLCINICLYNMLVQKGYIDGKNSQQFLSSRKALGEIIDKCNPFLRFLPLYCLDDYKERIRIKQISLLRDLDYDLYKKGVYKQKEVYEKLADKQKANIEKADNVEVYLYSYDYLLQNNEGSTENELNKNVSTFKNTTMMNTKKIGWYVVVTIMSVSISVTYKGFDIATILFSVILFIMWLSQGMMGYFNAFNFIVGKYRNVCYIEKTNYLEKFYNFMVANPHYYDKQVEDNLNNLLENKYEIKKEMALNENSSNNNKEEVSQ